MQALKVNPDLQFPMLRAAKLLSFQPLSDP
jgi:hypothetical protein